MILVALTQWVKQTQIKLSHSVEMDDLWNSKSVLFHSSKLQITCNFDDLIITHLNNNEHFGLFW